MMDGWGLGMGLGWLWVVIGVGLVVLLFGLAAGAFRDRPAQDPHYGGRDPSKDAKRVLDSRLARGEITPQEYEQTKRILGS